MAHGVDVDWLAVTLNRAGPADEHVCGNKVGPSYSSKPECVASGWRDGDSQACCTVRGVCPISRPVCGIVFQLVRLQEHAVCVMVLMKPAAD